VTAPASNALQSAIRRLAFREDLSADDIGAAFDVIMRGDASPAQVAALLMALRVLGESSAVVAGAAQALRRAMVILPSEDPDALVDTCGTGGGKVSTFNISTAAALVAAATGVRVAKHGNRSFTSRCGSADVLEALGVNIDVPVERMAGALRDAGIVFMFAPLMHPAMRHVGPIRGQLGIPTVMNIVGPLANPARAGRQIVGVADPERVPILAGALADLGSKRAMVVHGEPGLDEISPFGITTVVEVENGRQKVWRIDPARFGFSGITASDLSGGDPADNARIITEVLSGRGNLGAQAAVALNAGAAIFLAEVTDTFDQGVAAALETLRNGRALAVLERLRTAMSKTQ
jgi:anthranilate phosphoribosyltransferase